MPDTPQNDDQFADLFSKLPTAPPRSASGFVRSPDAPAHATSPEAVSAAAPAPTVGEPSVPQTRRAARAASQTVAPPPSAQAAVPQSFAAVASSPPAGSTGDETATHVRSIDALFAAEPDDEERQRLERHRRDRRKSRVAGWVVFGVILAILGGLTAGGFYVWNTYEDKIREIMGWEEPKDYEPGLATGEATITIASGDTGSTISQTLFDAGVTKTASAFYDYMISFGKDPNLLVPGVYSLQQQMTSEAAFSALIDPTNRLANTAQLREGLTVEQSIAQLADGTGIPLTDFEAAVADASAYGIAADAAILAAGGQPLEGWLFPATYTFDPGTTAQQVIQTLVDRTRQALDEAGVPVDRREEILTIASIIQREARFEADFYKVSRVIENRLDAGNQETFGKLQMDSTAQYGFHEHTGTVSTSADALADDNPWNTYVHAGLPVGPIANPGDVAIRAAMSPADGPWLYFVTVNLATGETVFSETYAEHLKAVDQWDQWCSANDSDDC